MNQRAQHLKNVFTQHITKEERNLKYEPSKSLLQPTYSTLVHSIPLNLNLQEFQCLKTKLNNISQQQQQITPSPRFGGPLKKSASLEQSKFTANPYFAKFQNMKSSYHQQSGSVLNQIQQDNKNRY